MADRFQSFGDSVTSPGRRSTPITPGDGVIDPIPKGLHVNVGGDVVGQLIDDVADRTFTLAAGVWPYRFKIIRASGTSATGLLGID